MPTVWTCIDEQYVTESSGKFYNVLLSACMLKRVLSRTFKAFMISLHPDNCKVSQWFQRGLTLLMMATAVVSDILSHRPSEPSTRAMSAGCSSTRRTSGAHSTWGSPSPRLNCGSPRDLHRCHIVSTCCINAEKEQPHKHAHAHCWRCMCPGEAFPLNSHPCTASSADFMRRA